MSDLCGACWHDYCNLKALVEDFECKHGMELEIKECPALAVEPLEEGEDEAL